MSGRRRALMRRMRRPRDTQRSALLPAANLGQELASRRRRTRTCSSGSMSLGLFGLGLQEMTQGELLSPSLRRLHKPIRRRPCFEPKACRTAFTLLWEANGDWLLESVALQGRPVRCGPPSGAWTRATSGAFAGTRFARQTLHTTQRQRQLCPGLSTDLSEVGRERRFARREAPQHGLSVLM